MINKLLGHVGVEVLRLNKPQKELVDNLQMGPCELQYWLVFLRIKSFACWVDLRWDCSKQIRGKLFGPQSM